MHLRGRFLLLAALVFSANSYADPTCTLSASKITQQIYQDGGAKTLQTVYGDDSNTWGDLLSCVATGKPAWVDIAFSLRPFSDGEISEDLDSSLSVALGNNPSYVLEKTASAVSLKSLCSGPWPDDEHFITYNEAKKESDKRLKAVESIKQADLLQKAQQCRAHLESTEPEERAFKD